MKEHQSRPDDLINSARVVFLDIAEKKKNTQARKRHFGSWPGRTAARFHEVMFMQVALGEFGRHLTHLLHYVV